MNVKDKIILIYDSRKTPKIRKMFIKVYNTIMSNIEESLKKYFVFASYDIAHNTRHGLSIDHIDIPIIRVYRKEEFKSNNFAERFLASDKQTMLNAIIDLVNADIYLSETEFA